MSEFGFGITGALRALAFTEVTHVVLQGERHE